MKRMLISTVVSIEKFSERQKAILLIEEHKDDLLKTGHFDEIRTIPSPTESMIFAITLLPKSEEEWEKYDKGSRPEKKKWFKENLLDTGLLKVLHSWTSEIPMPEAVSQ